MAQSKDRIEEEWYSPDKTLSIFSGSRIVTYMAISMLFHVLVIGGTSYSYVRGRFDQDWKEAHDKALTEKSAVKGVKNAADKKAPIAAATATNAPPVTSAVPPVAVAATNVSVQSELDRKIEEAFAAKGIDTNSAEVIEQLRGVPRERWLTPELLETLSTAKKSEIPSAPPGAVKID